MPALLSRPNTSRDLAPAIRSPGPCSGRRRYWHGVQWSPLRDTAESLARLGLLLGGPQQLELR